jgi:hypothetical protein
MLYVPRLKKNLLSVSITEDRGMGHLHYRALPILSKVVTGLPNFSIEQQDVCKWCALGKNAKAVLPPYTHLGYRGRNLQST